MEVDLFHMRGKKHVSDTLLYFLVILGPTHRTKEGYLCCFSGKGQRTVPMLNGWLVCGPAFWFWTGC